MDVLLFTSTLLLGLGLLIKYISKYQDFGIRLNEKSGFQFLLVWLVLGFILRLDYSDSLGCLIGIQPILEPKNILFSTISFVLVFWAFKTQNNKLKSNLVGVEIIYWIVKLMVFKGGYAVGFGGTPDITIVFYDLLAILVRLFILSQLLKINPYQFVKIGIVALLILGIKVSVFRVPMNMIYEDQWAFEKAKEVRKTLIGDWHGQVIPSEAVEVEFEEVVNIQIDSVHIYLDPIPGLEKQYQLELINEDYGLLSATGEYQDYSLFIAKRSKDSLKMFIDDHFKKYEFRLKKK